MIEQDIETLKNNLVEHYNSKPSKRNPRTIQQRLNANSIEALIKSIPKDKKDQKEHLIPYSTGSKTSYKILLVECASDVQPSISLSELKMLKESKSVLKKTLRSSLLVIPPEKAPLILKEFGKQLQKYKKVPTIVSTKVTKNMLEELEKKDFLRIEKNYTYLKLGKFQDPSKHMVDLLSKVFSLIKAQKRDIVELKLRCSQGPAFLVGKPSLSQLNEPQA